MINKNKILPRILFVWLLVGLMAVTALAADFNLTVVPTQVKTGKTFDDQEVNICLVARLENGVYQMQPAFAAKGLTVETLFAYDHTKVAEELAAFVTDASLSHKSLKTKDGKADFGSVASGLYLVYPAKDQLNAKVPFFTPFLVTVNQEDVTCYPKVPEHLDPNPRPKPPKPKPVGPTLPKTWDDAKIELAILTMVLTAAGAIGLTVYYRCKFSNEEQEDTVLPDNAQPGEEPEEKPAENPEERSEQNPS